MSYTKRFCERIPVHYSGTITYPASQYGGTKSFSGTVYEDVNIEVYVDTDDFDKEVYNCSGNVGALTGSIVATEAAQIASIRQNSQKVGDSIIKGFFTTVHSEISQQIMELSTQIDTTLVHLQKLAERCKSKQLQMQGDYSRITSRYLKIFEDLNNELEHRIFELCRPVFTFKQSTDERILGVLCDDTATTAVVSGTEHSLLEARLASSLAKRRTVDTIQQANNFLTKQKQAELVLNHCTIDEEKNGSIYLPVCYLETNDNGVTNRHMYKPEKLENVNSQRIIEEISQQDMHNELSDSSAILEENFNRQVSSAYKNLDDHDKRVMDYVTKLFYSNINKK